MLTDFTKGIENQNLALRPRLIRIYFNLLNTKKKVKTLINSEFIYFNYRYYKYF